MILVKLIREGEEREIEREKEKEEEEEKRSNKYLNFLI